MLMIRLQRVGKPKQPAYRFIVSDKTKDTQWGSLENLGNFSPLGKTSLNLKKDRIQYWLSKGAQCSATVHNILVNEGLIKAKKAKNVKVSKKRAVKLAAKKAGVEKK